MESAPHWAELLRDKWTKNTKQSLSSRSLQPPFHWEGLHVRTQTSLYFLHLATVLVSRLGNDAREAEVARRRAAFFHLSTVLISRNTNMQLDAEN